MELTPFETFIETLAKAANEAQKREAFIALAATGFGDSSLASSLALGAEYQVRFREAGLVRRGAIDCFYGNLVIEFEKRLQATGAHALEQLRGYVAGAWNEDGGTHRAYLAVASDGVHWEVYSPRHAKADGPIDASHITLELTETCDASVVGADGLRLFLNRLLYREFLLSPTVANFVGDFGLDSPAFKRASTDLEQKLDELSDDPQRTVLQRQWATSLRVAYGTSVDSDELFVRHTYLAVLARLLVWVALEHRHLSDDEVQDVLSGEYFRGRQIANLVEHDFFAWHEIPSSTNARRTWIALSRHLAGYDLNNVREDILKPLYERLVDPETRHDLGEYYTPDWLATEIVGHLLVDWDYSSGMPTVLDPACGSGTFLRAVIALLRERSPAPAHDLLEDVLRSVIGIDIHPLAVIIARATVLLTVADLVAEALEPITLPVFLANSLTTVELYQALRLWGDEEVFLSIGDGEQRRTYTVPTALVHDGPRFDDAVDNVLEVARAYARSPDPAMRAAESLKARIGDALADYPGAIEVLGDMTTHLVELARARRDTVYGFLLKNHYRPTMLQRSFDYVVGNPPWLTIGDVDNVEYQESIKALVRDTRIASRAVGEQSHTELATLFLPQAVRLFLNPGVEGRGGPSVAFVLPRSVFVATHHRHLREGGYRALFDVLELWDLMRVTPLFNVPSCVLFLAMRRPRPAGRKAGRMYVGTLPAKDPSAQEAHTRLSWTATEFQLAYLGRRSAWRPVSSAEISGEARRGEVEARRGEYNAYRSRFRQGAILYPQTLMVIAGDRPVRRGSGSVRVHTDPKAALSAKVCKSSRVNHLIERSNVYSTAAAENLVSFSLVSPLWTVVLPTRGDPGTDNFGPSDSEALRLAGRIGAAAWLDWAEQQWAACRKPGELLPLFERIDYLGHLSAQAKRLRWLVLYTASGSRAFAAVLDAEVLDPPFVARDKTYWASFESAEEAHYVCAFLNSDSTLRQVEDWMTRGLMGRRDTHKRVLDVPWPAFRVGDGVHRELASLSMAVANAAEHLVAAFAPASTARLRTRVRSSLPSEEMLQLEALVKNLSDQAGRQR